MGGFETVVQGKWSFKRSGRWGKFDCNSLHLWIAVPIRQWKEWLTTRHYSIVPFPIYKASSFSHPSWFCLVWFLESILAHHWSQKWLLENKKHNGSSCVFWIFCRRWIFEWKTSCVVFNIEKAYGTTWKCGIWKIYMISHFQSERKFRVRVRTFLSNVYYQDNRVLQGTISSFTLSYVKIKEFGISFFVTLMPIVANSWLANCM